MDFGLRDKIVVITGASRGIGFATATAFGREGAHIVMAARNQERLEGAADKLRAETGCRVDTFSCDLTLEADCVRLIETAQRLHGRIDVLVNNASGQLPMGEFTQLTSAQWQSAWTQKLQVYVTLARLVFPIMQRQSGGRIICVIGAHAARNPAPSYLAIGAVSAGLINFVKGLADLGARDNILVTGVSPSGVDTGERWQAWLARRAASEGKTIEQVQEEKTVDYALGRPARPEEVGDVICFLGSARASYISGVVLTIDGNLTRGVSI